jgi:phospholipid/cholesterol/gamma-HCH transport system permease protein
VTDGSPAPRALPPPARWIEALGYYTLYIVESLGRFGRFLGQAIALAFIPPLKLGRLAGRIYFIGFKSLTIVILTGAFTGMALGLQVFLTLQRVGSEAFVGPAVGIALVRELGPVLTAVFVTGLAGSALTAELGIMRITEQIDALMVMALNPMRYLVVPAILAGLITFPMLTAIFDVAGIYGGYLVAVILLGMSPGTYFGQMQAFADMGDVMVGFWKSLAFGALVPWVCTYKGFHCGHGAEGVSRATTEAVVLSCVLILVFNYFLGSVLP